MEQSGLAKLRSVEGRQDSTTNGRMKAGNTLKLQPFVLAEPQRPLQAISKPNRLAIQPFYLVLEWLLVAFM
jgi:hypothetical protein